MGKGIIAGGKTCSAGTGNLILTGYRRNNGTAGKGCALCSAFFAAESRIFHYSHSLVGARHRRKYGHFSVAGCSSSAHLAGKKSRRAGGYSRPKCKRPPW